MHRLPRRKQGEHLKKQTNKTIYHAWNQLVPVKQPTTVKLDEVCDLASVQVDANCVIDLDEGVWVADGAGVVGNQVGDSLGANDDLLDFAQLVL